MHCRYTWGC